MQVQKAVITAAAPNQNRLPLQQLVDRGGQEKTALQTNCRRDGGCWH